MNQKKEGLTATRLSPLEVFFDLGATYNLQDWLFRTHSYYQMLLCTLTGPNGIDANEWQIEQMVGVLDLIQWAEALPLGTKIGYAADENGVSHPYSIEPPMRYLS